MKFQRNLVNQSLELKGDKLLITSREKRIKVFTEGINLITSKADLFVCLSRMMMTTRGPKGLETPRLEEKRRETR